MSSSEQLNILKQNIECLEKHRQIEILRIINENQSTIINENKNGIYINMTSLTEDTLTELKNFIKYIYFTLICSSGYLICQYFPIFICLYLFKLVISFLKVRYLVDLHSEKYRILSIL